MIITKERTRLIFTEYNDAERSKIENTVAAMDNVFMYEDKDNHFICLPTGMETKFRQIFRNIKFIDKSSEYWPYDTIAPVEHNAKPRNQLQIDFINFVLENAKKKQKVAGILSPGQGKMEPYSRKIPTPNGWKCMGDLQVGDKIFGSNGKPITVLDIYEQGEQDIYKITFNDGRYALCGKEHLWTVYTRCGSPKMKTITTEDMMRDYRTFQPYNISIGKSDVYDYNYMIPLVSAPVRFNEQEVSISPYVVGTFIANGILDNEILTLTSMDSYVPRKVSTILGFTYEQKESETYVFYDANGELVKTNDVFESLSEITESPNRRMIPNVYRYNSLDTQIELLRGIFDSDGKFTHTSIGDDIMLHSSSSTLLSEVRQIILGFGFITSTVGESDIMISIKISDEFKYKLFSNQMKIDLLPNTKNYDFHNLIIKNITYATHEKARCIRVDAPDELYLTEDFIVTHNTFMACYSAIAIGLRTLIIVPTSGIKDQWEDTLVNMFKVPKERVLNVKSPKQFMKVKADFVIVSQASLAALNKNYDLERIMKDNKFGIKVIDEVQMWFKNIVHVDGNSNIANNWYLTGTFGRSGETENKLYQEMFGDLAIFREKDKKPTLFNPKPGNIYGMKPHMHVTMIWTSSGLTKKEIKKVTSSMRYSEREGKWMRFGVSVPAYSELIFPPDGSMTKYLNTCLRVIKHAESQVGYGRTLILVSTIAATAILQSYLEKMFPNKVIGTYHSKNNKVDNVKNKTECDILISTISSAGTGFDMKDLSKLITCTQWQSWILSDQISGRLRRRPDGKDTYMWDIADSQIPQLRAWARARADVYKRKGKSFSVKDM